MKKFRFSLQKVLDLREFKEREAEIALGKAVSEVVRIQSLLDECAKRKVASKNMRSMSLDMEYLLSIEKYLLRLNGESEKYLEEIAQAKLIVEEKREILQEAVKERKVLSKLKEKQFSTWRSSQFRKEEQEVEDSFRQRE